MLIQNTRAGNRGMFFVEDGGNILAEMVYSMASPTKMIIEHTEVSDELKGQNVGSELVQTAVDFARTHDIKIVPLCPFANAIFKRKPEYWDVLYQP